MAMNRYAKKVAQQKERAAGRAADRLKDMSSYLGEDRDKAQLENIPLKNIKLNEANDYRQLDREEDIQTLAEDIERNGLLHNLVVSRRRPGEYVILSGERRYRALTLLHNRRLEKRAAGQTADVGRWRRAPCRVLTGLSPRQERIVLDAANLQTRGGAGNERLTRLAMERYRDNVKREYGLSETEARGLLMKVSNIGRSSIFRNFKIIDNLIPPFQDMLNASLISKKEADELVKLSTECQTAANGVILAFKALWSENDEGYRMRYKKVMDGILTASQAKTDGRAMEMIENIAQNLPAPRPKTRPVTVKSAAKASYRDMVLRDCRDIMTRIDRLKKKKVDKIKEIDRAADDYSDTVAARIDRLIDRLEEFKALIGGQD